jgi:diadenosine tetraphosphate (Ap4A) HIT family hydrolase
MCHYCKIVSGELPASVVYEDEYTLAFLVIKPVTPGHVVVIPKKHVESFAELSDVGASDLIHAVKRVDQAIKASDLTCEAISIYLGDGERAGQEIPHIHVHVFPRFSEDQFTINFDTELIRHRSIAELEGDAQKIREGFKRIR